MSQPANPPILCIGSVLWDIIGRAPRAMRQGSDVAGRITQLPGGVALNIAMTFTRRRCSVRWAAMPPVRSLSPNVRLWD